MTLSSFIISALSLSVAFSNALYIVLLALYIFSIPFRKYFNTLVLRHVTWIVFLLSLVAVVGSLAFSNIIGFPPCELCWYQRIVMYPQVLITFIALIRKRAGEARTLVEYLFPFSVIGFVISLYQSYVQWGGGSSLLKCTLAGGDCAKLYVYAYGYITIPFMALSMFGYLISISLIYLYGRKK